MLSEKRKTQILASLKEDYIPMSDIFFETCSDILADMYFTGDLQSPDKFRTWELEREYAKVMKISPEKAIPLIEELYDLQEKYSQKRLLMGD